MQVFGTSKNYIVAVATVSAADFEMDDDVSSEHLIKINPNTTGVHILLAPVNNNDDANIDDYLLPNQETEYLVGRGIDRISFYKEGAGNAKVYVMVLF